MLAHVVRIRLFKEHCMSCTAIWPRAPTPSPAPVPLLPGPDSITFPSRGCVSAWPQLAMLNSDHVHHGSHFRVQFISVCGQINQQICTKGKWCFVPAGQSSVILKTSSQLRIYFWDIFHRYFSHLYRDMSWSVFMDSCQPTVYPTPWFISLFSIHCLTSLIFGFGWGLSAYALHGYSVRPLNIFGS